MWPTLFLIAALITGFTTIGILLARSSRLPTDRWLVGVVLVFMGAVCHNLLLEARVYERNPALYFLPVIAQLFIGPMFWFYARGMMGREPMALLSRCIHLAPGVIQLGIQVWAFQLDNDPKYAFWSTTYEPWLQPLIFWLGQVSMIAYLYASHRMLDAWRNAMEGQFSNIDPVALHWLDRLLLLFGALVLVSITLGAVPKSFSAAVLPTDVLKTMIVCAIGWQGLRQARIVRAEQEVAIIPETAPSHPLEPVEEASSIVVQLVEPEPLPVTPIDEALLLRLDSLMRERKLYQRPDLTITDLAHEAGVPSKQVSSTINNGHQITFLTYVNRFRVNAVKEALAEGKHRNLSLLGVALEAGFNSKSTFNRVFRELTGSTPSEWLKTLAP
jgi:AraC-like DNA-binding protein